MGGLDASLGAVAHKYVVIHNIMWRDKCCRAQSRTGPLSETLRPVLGVGGQLALSSLLSRRPLRRPRIIVDVADGTKSASQVEIALLLLYCPCLDLTQATLPAQTQSKK